MTPMASAESGRSKYVYKYTFGASRTEELAPAPADVSSADLQAYINEILGVKKDKPPVDAQ